MKRPLSLFPTSLKPAGKKKEEEVEEELLSAIGSWERNHINSTQEKNCSS